ncbi:MAG: type IV pilus modification protein PilV [Gammaproteobacteria bacterium]|nr:type IV pilus modification protein PilV [Gammaproteobacteria bacterium]
MSVKKNRSSCNSRWPGQSDGFSLIEVLISVLILSVGLLGTARLQVLGLSYNQSAYLRSQASIVAYDIVDRMRANPIGVASGGYNAIDSTTPPSDPACIAAGCTDTELIAHDIRDWSLASLAILPSGSGTVTRNGNIFTVTVNWAEKGAVENVSFTFRL